MFLITTTEVREQEGKPSYCLFPDDIDYLASNRIGRVRLLEVLGKESVIISTMVEAGEHVIKLDELLECESGIHSKL